MCLLRLKFFVRLRFSCSIVQTCLLRLRAPSHKRQILCSPVPRSNSIILMIGNVYAGLKVFVRLRLGCTNTKSFVRPASWNHNRIETVILSCARYRIQLQTGGWITAEKPLLASTAAVVNDSGTGRGDVLAYVKGFLGDFV